MRENKYNSSNTGYKSKPTSDLRKKVMQIDPFFNPYSLCKPIPENLGRVRVAGSGALGGSKFECPKVIAITILRDAMLSKLLLVLFL